MCNVRHNGMRAPARGPAAPRSTPGRLQGKRHASSDSARLSQAGHLHAGLARRGTCPGLGRSELTPRVTWNAIDRYSDTTTAAMLLRDVALRPRGSPWPAVFGGAGAAPYALLPMRAWFPQALCANRVGANPMPSRAGAPAALSSPAYHTHGLRVGSTACGHGLTLRTIAGSLRVRARGLCKSPGDPRAWARGCRPAASLPWRTDAYQRGPHGDPMCGPMEREPGMPPPRRPAYDPSPWASRRAPQACGRAGRSWWPARP